MNPILKISNPTDIDAFYDGMIEAVVLYPNIAKLQAA